MCSEFGGFEANVMESAVASTIALDADWRPIRDGTAIAVMAETTARTICADGVVVVPLKPPPQYVLALAWRPDEQSAAARRCLDYLRTYRDRHAWISDPDGALLAHDHGPGLVVSTSRPGAGGTHRSSPVVQCACEPLRGAAAAGQSAARERQRPSRRRRDHHGAVSAVPWSADDVRDAADGRKPAAG